MLLALALGWWLDLAPFATLAWTWRGLAWGIAATAPLLLGLAWCLCTRLAPVARLVRVAEERIAPMFAGSGPVTLGLVALFAGLGEETLFRGVIQPALAMHLPMWGALAATAALFGLAHWITPTYAILAGMVGAVSTTSSSAVAGNWIEIGRPFSHSAWKFSPESIHCPWSPTTSSSSVNWS